jgi:DUF971 family protein
MEPFEIRVLGDDHSLVQCHGDAKCFGTIPYDLLDALSATAQRQRDAIGAGDYVAGQADRDVKQLAHHVCFLAKEIDPFALMSRVFPRRV